MKWIAYKYNKNAWEKNISKFFLHFQEWNFCFSAGVTADPASGEETRARLKDESRMLSESRPGLLRRNSTKITHRKNLEKFKHTYIFLQSCVFDVIN